MKWQKFVRLIMCAGLSLVSSCATYREQVWKEQHDPAQNRTRQWAKLCEPYAKMSYLAYRSPEKVYVEKYENELKSLGWELMGKCEPPLDHAGAGLYFEVWENRQVTPKEYVIAFRGTQFDQRNDWVSNLRWFRWARHVKEDQYDVARDESLRVLASIVRESNLEKVKIVTTGHSLGAGIAQSVLYGSVPYVDQSIVFDPSPVTGFFDLDKKLRDEYHSLEYRPSFAGHRIVRAYAKGEILQYVRNTAQLFNRPHPLIHTVEFKTAGEKGLISKHSMLELTKTIVESANYEPEHPAISQKLPTDREPEHFVRMKTHLNQPLDQTPEVTVTPATPPGESDPKAKG